MAEKYQIELTPAAELDLLDIVEYLMEEVSPDTAEHVNDGILATIETLEILPHRNPKLDFSPQHRFILKWSYKIVYTIVEEDSTVLVVGIEHTSRNPQILVERFGD